MAKARQMAEKIKSGALDTALGELYGAARIMRQRQRYANALQAFVGLYGDERDIALYSTPGRTEIGGNHTDHNNGLVMAAAIDLDILAVVAKNDEEIVRVHSEGFPMADEISLSTLAPQKAEAGHSSALIRGVAAGIQSRGGAVGGFNAYTTSDVLKGSGLSSSAAFEVCLGAIFNGEYSCGRFSPAELGIIGQYAENVFFEKPSGLMDQLACAVGGAVTIDLEDPKNPFVTQVPMDLSAHGYCLVITDTRGDHADLTDDYTAIRREMEKVAAFFGKATLREVERERFLGAIAQVRAQTGDRAVLRTIHFFEECRRVGVLQEALQKDDFSLFLRTIAEGGHSSFEMNQNAYSLKTPQQQGVPLGLVLSQLALGGDGAWRLQGGGFAGTIQAFVPQEMVSDYQKMLETVFGAGACHVLAIRAQGCAKVWPEA